MSTPDALNAYIDAAARVLELPLEPDWMPAVRAHLELMLRLARDLQAFELPDEAEPAPVFEAGGA